jgi:hypothetical protein
MRRETSSVGVVAGCSKVSPFGRYNYGLGWGASMHGGHGLWTQPFAAAALVAAVATACLALTPLPPPPLSTLTPDAGEATSSATVRAPAAWLRVWWRLWRFDRVLCAAWCGVWVACAGLCNVLYGYMAAVAISVAAAIATADAARACLARPRALPPVSDQQQQQQQQQQQPRRVPRLGQRAATVAEKAAAGDLLAGVAVLVVAGFVGASLSGYFIGPHLWRREAVSDYEARDYKVIESAKS